MPTSVTPSKFDAVRARRLRPSGESVAGFTLIELLVVLAIALLLVGVAPFALGRLHDAAEYRSTVRLMLSAMASARQQASVEGRNVVFFVDLDQRRFGVEGRTIYDIPAALAVRATVAGQELDRAAVAGIRFFPDGGATGGAIDIVRPSGSGVRLRADWLFGRISQEPLAQ